jgi:hypothetical protein
MTSKKQKALTDSKQHWRTPPYLFDFLNKSYHFTVDGAANEQNALLPNYWTDFESADWKGQRVFMNPPFALTSLAIEKAWHEWGMCNPETIVLLILGKSCGSPVCQAILRGANIHMFSRRIQFLNHEGKAGDARFDRDIMLLEFVRGRSNRVYVSPLYIPTRKEFQDMYP